MHSEQLTTMADQERSKLLPTPIWYRNQILGRSSKYFRATVASTDPGQLSHFWTTMEDSQHSRSSPCEDRCKSLSPSRTILWTMVGDPILTSPIANLRYQTRS
jgi:hypothetical protein